MLQDQEKQLTENPIFDYKLWNNIEKQIGKIKDYEIVEGELTSGIRATREDGTKFSSFINTDNKEDVISLLVKSLMYCTQKMELSRNSYKNTNHEE